MKFSANLGFLWTDLDLPEAIHAAKDAGFDAVECHWPYGIDPQVVRDALEQTNLPMLGLNTSRGNSDSGEFGLCALHDRTIDARQSIDQAIDYATKVHASNVHVMCGVTTHPDAQSVFLDNLQYATQKASEHGITILIEPINTLDVPEYFLSTPDQALDIIHTLGAENLKLMFDCYHIQRMQGELLPTLKKALPFIGHIQFAGVPTRGAPDEGELNYKEIFQEIKNLGWEKPLGAEYKPNGKTQDSLVWLTSYKTL